MIRNELFDAIAKSDISRIQKIVDSKPTFGWFEFDLNSALRYLFENYVSDLNQIAKILLEAKADPNIQFTIYHEGGGDADGGSPHTTQYLIEYACQNYCSELANILLDANATVSIVPDEFSLFRHLFPPKGSIYLSTVLNPGPLVAWRVFKAASSPQSIITHAVSHNFNDNNFSGISAFVFLKALASLWISQKRHFRMATILSFFIPPVLAELVIAYSGEQKKESKEIECEIASTPIVKHLPDTEPAYIMQEKLTPSEVRSLEQADSNQIMEVHRLSLEPDTKEVKSVNFLSPLMIAAGKGHPIAVRSLLSSRADPTFSLRGNTALIWALHGKRTEHQQIAKILLESLEPYESNDESNDCRIS